MIYERTRRFDKSLESLPANIQEKTFKALTLFVENPAHPSLQVKPMKGRFKGIWEGRVDQFYRFTFEYYQDTASTEMVCSFRNVGRHDILDKHP